MYYTMLQIKSYIACFFALIVLACCYFWIPIPVVAIVSVYIAAYYMTGSEHKETSFVRRLTTFAVGALGVLFYGINAYQIEKYFSFNGHTHDALPQAITAIAFVFAIIHTQYTFAHKMQ